MIPTGFEPVAYCLEGSCSIQLSYGTDGCKMGVYNVYNQKRGMIAHPPCRGGRIRTCDLLVPNQARWPDYATPRTEVRYGLNLWRWERDSNSRYSYPYDSLANCWFQPLTHPTMCSMNGWQKYKNIPFLKAFFDFFYPKYVNSPCWLEIVTLLWSAASTLPTTWAAIPNCSEMRMISGASSSLT